MSTQLRLVESSPAGRPTRSRSATRGRARRQVTWDGEWRLDSRTRRVGRQGIAAARAQLERVKPVEEHFSRAS